MCERDSHEPCAAVDRRGGAADGCNSREAEKERAEDFRNTRPEFFHGDTFDLSDALKRRSLREIREGSPPRQFGRESPVSYSRPLAVSIDGMHRIVRSSVEDEIPSPKLLEQGVVIREDFRLKSELAPRFDIRRDIIRVEALFRIALN